MEIVRNPDGSEKGGVDGLLYAQVVEKLAAGRQFEVKVGLIMFGMMDPDQ